MRNRHPAPRTNTIVGYLASRSKAFLIVLGACLLLLVTVAKYFAGPQLIFSAIYLVPVSFAIWFLSAQAGLVSALASVLAMLVINLADRHYYSHPAIPYWNAAMDLAVFLFAIVTLSEAKGLYAQALDLSRKDPLTGIANRRDFLEALSNEAIRARRYLRPLTLVYIDVDDFKQVNDTYGHAIGDAVLGLIGTTIRNSVREIDSVARLGGDEFALLLPETEEQAARLVVEKVRAGLRNALDAEQFHVSFSIGVATFITPLSSVGRMIEAADRLMYTVKGAGKNSFAQQRLG